MARNTFELLRDQVSSKGFFKNTSETILPIFIPNLSYYSFAMA